MLSQNVIEAIGRTPLVRLKLGAERGVEVYAKLEMNNLFAMKDRVARQIITEARRTGVLAEGAPIVESSSGTMALGVALVGTSLGHPVHIVTDPRIDRTTLAKLEALGCEVHVVPAMDERGWQGARLTRLREIMDANPGAFWPRQYENPQNPAAYRYLAEELLTDLESVDVLVGAVGSGGSLCGTSRVLRESLPYLHVVGVDCVGSVLFGQPDRPKRLQSGLGNSLHPQNLDHSLIDEVHWLNDREAFGATRELAREEKLFAGNTSGSVYRVLGAVAERSEPGTVIVGIFPDRGDRYADTVHSDAYWAEQELERLPLAGRPRQVPAGTEVQTWSYVLTRDEAPRPAFVFVESNTTGTGMLALRIAAEAGYEAVLATNDPGRYLGLAGTGATVVECDTNESAALIAAVTKAVEPERIAAVSTTSEFYLIAAAGLATAVGLPAEDAQAITGCRNKGSLRRVLERAGVRQPAFEVVQDGAAAAAAAARVGTPCVVKPVDDSGSTRVRRCDTAEQAAALAAEIVAVRENGRGQATAGEALVEQFLDAPEYSVEMFGTDGGHRLVGITEKTVTGAPNFVESRHIVPAALPAEAAQEMEATVRAALAATGLRRGPSHTEVKLTADGSAIVEINPRLAGGLIPELYRLATGVDLLAAQVGHAAGAEPVLPGGFSRYAGIQFIMPTEAGELERVTGVEEALAVEGVEQVTVTAAAGRRVAPPTDAYGRIGHIIAAGESRAAVVEALERARALIALHLRDR
ncbi:pyridoxal-phosphate dependent enzyme [Streptomyces sp. ET3-23]|uniref:pyridoxal-phosphate dependent enzyme n=1 Tax=Streptomyces sp. ET3-23 TaxID=2885643 RepID=UPI001D11C92D|nr:pyridoxal-phosphate dependent enzyme [Streptomyces sp. ET3-23]MCC2274675.1 pyridoxal-phosphate dependent enzyme [Streptomyces sp. ET3-23]